MACDVTMWTQSSVKSQKIEYLTRLFLYRTETYTVVTLITKLHHMSTVTFPWQHNGLQALSNQRENQSIPPSRSVICYCCSFSGCDQIWTLHSASTSTSTSTRKSVKLRSNNENNNLALFLELDFKGVEKKMISWNKFYRWTSSIRNSIIWTFSLAPIFSWILISCDLEN